MLIFLCYYKNIQTQYNLDEYPIIYVSTKCDSDLVQQVRKNTFIMNDLIYFNIYIYFVILTI